MIFNKTKTMIKSFRFLTYSLNFHKSNLKKGASQSTMLSMLRETVKDSLKTQKFGMQGSSKPEKPTKTPKNPKTHLIKPSKQHQKQSFEKPKVQTQKHYPKEKTSKMFEEVGESDKEFETIDLSTSDSESNDMKPSSLTTNPTQMKQETGEIIARDYFNIDFLQFPWKFDNEFERPVEKNLKAPVPVDSLLFESQVFSIIKGFLMGLEEGDLEALQELVEPSFLKKIGRNLKKMKEGEYRVEVKNLKKKGYFIDIYNISTFFTVGVSENRLKNDSASYFDIRDANIQGVPCKNFLHKSLGPQDRTLIIMQADCSIESEINVQIIDKNGNVARKSLNEKGKQIHLFSLETVLMDQKYEDFTRLGVELEKKELNPKEKSKQLKKLRFYLIDFDKYMLGNPLLKETIDVG